MSRLSKAEEFLFGKYLQQDPAANPYIDWSPNNVKTLVLGSTLIGVEFFIPCNIGKGRAKYNYGKLGDLDEDLDVLHRGLAVRSVLRVLAGNRPCNNIEEIIICAEMYDKGLLKIDTDLKQMTSNDLSDVFPRLYAITVVDGKSADVFSLLNSEARNGEMHLTDVLVKDTTRFQAHPYYVNKLGWNKRFTLQPELYKMDFDKPSLADAKESYALHTYFIQNGGVAKSEAKVGFEVLQHKEIRYPGLNVYNDIYCDYVKDVEDGVICVVNPDATSAVVRLNSYTGLCTNILSSIEEYFNGLHNISEIRISYKGMLYLNGVAVKPMVGYDILGRIPKEYQYVLFGKDAVFFQQDMQKQFGRVLSLDADRSAFSNYCRSLAVNWAFFVNLSNTGKLQQLKRLQIDCPVLLTRYKYNFGISEWSDLYQKIPSLNGDGIYIMGYRVDNTTEPDFYEGIEKRVYACVKLQTALCKSLNLMLPYIPVNQAASSVGVVNKVSQGISKLSLKVSAMFHLLGEDTEE